MKLTKETSIRTYIRNKEDEKELMQLSKEELIERHFYRMKNSIFAGMCFGIVLCMFLSLILFSHY